MFKLPPQKAALSLGGHTLVLAASTDTMQADSASPDTVVSQESQPVGYAPTPREALAPMSSMAQSGMLTAELHSPHLVVFSGGTAFNGIAGYMRKEFPRGACYV